MCVRSCAFDYFLTSFIDIILVVDYVTLCFFFHLQFECCGLIEGYKDWGSSIPASCNCHYPGKCVSTSAYIH